MIERDLPTPEAVELLDLVRQITRDELAPVADKNERDARFPREYFRLLGKSGLLGLPYPESYGGAAQPFVVYLQVLEELAAGWLSVALGLSVHTLSAHPLANFGADSQRQAWLADLIGGELLGAYCLSEQSSGSDAAAMTTTATPTSTTASTAAADGPGYLIKGAKAWITHGGQADYYTLMARTSSSRSGGISCFLVPADISGLSFGDPEKKMGLNGSTTAAVYFDDVEIAANRLIGAVGQGFPIALNALDSGRLGIAACAVGLAQSAFDAARSYAKQRHQFGHAIARFQGIEFMLADLATSIEAARSLYLRAATLKDAGKPFSSEAAMAKLFATDMAMRVTTDAVQILGGSGYVEDYPAERYMREAKVLQIVEGTNQIQRLVIGRAILS